MIHSFIQSFHFLDLTFSTTNETMREVLLYNVKTFSIVFFVLVNALLNFTKFLPYRIADKVKVQKRTTLEIEYLIVHKQRYATLS